LYYRQHDHGVEDQHQPTSPMGPILIGKLFHLQLAHLYCFLSLAYFFIKKLEKE